MAIAVRSMRAMYETLDHELRRLGAYLPEHAHRFEVLFPAGAVGGVLGGAIIKRDGVAVAKVRWEQVSEARFELVAERVSEHD